MIRILLAALLLICLASGAVVAWGYASFTRPGSLDQPAIVYIEPGSGLFAIAETLADNGVIDDPFVFRIGVRVVGIATKLRAGEYSFPARLSPLEAARVLERGETVLRRVTIAEGLTSQEVVAQLMAVEGLYGDVGRRVPEGAILPETYYFSYGDARTQIIDRMMEAMETALAELWPTRDQSVPIDTPREALILASIVEKETGVAAERPRVAAVFINRLRMGMRLQSDPTVVYGITEGAGPLGRRLTRADLRQETAYNTYVIDGLPPGPIANPGRAAIEAVLRPAQTNELYFVADGTGGHVFSTTLEEHNRNVRKWRKIRDQQTGGDG
ncbi:MAG: endolytic transglycosylase MltG [Rhodospirillales bacterium]